MGLGCRKQKAEIRKQQSESREQGKRNSSLGMTAQRNDGRKTMRKAMATLMTALLGVLVLPLAAQDRENQRLEECGTVMREILNVPDNIPQDLLDKAECVLVIPGTKKLAIGIGGSYGRGAIV